MNVTETLAGFAAEVPVDGSARHAGRRTLMNSVTVAVGGSASAATAIALRVVMRLGGTAKARVIGHAAQCSPASAALVNGISAHVDDFDDTHFETIVHPGAAVVPAALAAAESVEASGQELLDALVVGVEIALRLGLTVYPSAFDTGWHMSGIVGPVGAAAAVGRLLGLDAAAMRNALAIAEAQGAGTQEALGTMTKSLHLGKAAANGLEAALAAEAGLSGPRDAFSGFAEVFAGPAGDPAAAIRGLGTTWEIERNAFKPYSCGVVSHAAIDGAISLRRDGCDWREFKRVNVRTNPVVLDVMGVRDPQAGLPAKFSIYHCVAVCLCYGAAGPLQFADEVACDPELVALRNRIEVTLDPGCRVDESEVTAVRHDGTVHTVHVEHARSSASAPLSDRDLREKAHTAANELLGADRVDRLVDALFDVDSVANVSDLLKLTIPEEVLASR